MDTAGRLLPPSSSAAAKEEDYHRKATRRAIEETVSEHDVKRRRLPSNKVCIVCHCSSPNSTSDGEYDIFIVDLDLRRSNTVTVDADDGFIPRVPTFRLDRGCFYAQAFCVLHSKLYMFEGYDRSAKYPGKSVRTLDLSSADVLTSSNLKLPRDMLCGDDVPDMQHTKNRPVAIPTPDGRILVFSSLIRFIPFAEAAPQIDFEVYDPTNRSWEELPGICDILGGKRACICLWITAYTFLRGSVFLVQTDTGMFTLDLASPNTQGWQKLYVLSGAMRIPCNNGSFLVIEEDLCLTTFGAYDIQEEIGFSWRYDFPLSSFDADCQNSPIPAAITLVDHDVVKGEYIFCIIQTGLVGDTMGYPRLTIDVYKCDLLKYREDKRERGTSELSTSISDVRSFKFLLNTQQYDSFRPFDLFSF